MILYDVYLCESMKLAFMDAGTSESVERGRERDDKLKSKHHATPKYCLITLKDTVRALRFAHGSTTTSHKSQNTSKWACVHMYKRSLYDTTTQYIHLGAHTHNNPHKWQINDSAERLKEER